MQLFYLFLYVFIQQHTWVVKINMHFAWNINVILNTKKKAYQFVRSIITCLSLQSLNERFPIIFLLTKYLKTICQLWRYYLLTKLKANSRKLSMPVLRQNQYPLILFLAEKNYVYMTWTFKIMLMWHGKKFFIKPPTAVSPRTFCLFFSKQFDTL